MNSERHPVFTIGHSNLEIGKFVALLKQNGIQAIADVRSSPYSQYNPQFNRELLQKSLQKDGIAYVFLGEELGARRSERECYLEGRADYGLISQTPAFKRGIERVTQGRPPRKAQESSQYRPGNHHRPDRGRWPGVLHRVPRHQREDH